MILASSLMCLLLECLVLTTQATYIPEPFHTLVVPFKSDNGGPTTERVFLEFHCHTVLYDQNMAMKMELLASDDVAMTVDKCGKRLFETIEDTDNATYVFDRDWISAMLTGISKSCDVITEYAVDFTFDCTGPCNGSLTFSLVELEPKMFAEKAYEPNGVVEFKTVGGENPAHANWELGPLIETIFLNPHCRLEFVVNYTTEYHLAFEKCGLEFLQLDGHKGQKRNLLQWEEIKIARLLATTQCEDDPKNMINYVMTSDEPGNGTLTFHWTRTKEPLEHHPGNDVAEMSLAMGLPRHQKPKKEVPTQMGRLASIAIVPVIAVIRYRYFI